MTAQEAINFFRNFLIALDFNDPVRQNDYSKSSELAIDALEKQVPKKPNRGWCPTCGSDIEYELDYGGELRCEYCSGCGQAIDWSEVEE